MTLLPSTSGMLERELESLGERYIFDTPIQHMWDPYKTDSKLLIYLAWALSVDVWDESWNDDIKRKVCATSLDIHRLKGSSKALQSAIDALGYNIAIEYWYQNPKNIEKGYFQVLVSPISRAVNSSFLNEIMLTINDNKRGSLHLNKIIVSQDGVCGNTYAASYQKNIYKISIGPKPPQPAVDAVVNTAPYVTVFEICEITIYE